MRGEEAPRGYVTPHVQVSADEVVSRGMLGLEAAGQEHDGAHWGMGGGVQRWHDGRRRAGGKSGWWSGVRISDRVRASLSVRVQQTVDNCIEEVHVHLTEQIQLVGRVG